MWIIHFVLFWDLSLCKLHWMANGPSPNPHVGFWLFSFHVCEGELLFKPYGAFRASLFFIFISFFWLLLHYICWEQSFLIHYSCLLIVWRLMIFPLFWAWKWLRSRETRLSHSLNLYLLLWKKKKKKFYCLSFDVNKLHFYVFLRLYLFDK